MRSIEALLDEALALPEHERASLAARLLRSLEPEDDAPLSSVEWEAAWNAEVDRRVAEVRAGEVELVDGDAVLQEGRAGLRASPLAGLPVYRKPGGR